MKHSDLTKKDVAKEGKMPQAAIDALAKKNGKSTKKDSKKDVQTEDLALMAQKAEMDHEVQMARSDLYKAAKYSIKLHEMLKNVSEEQGLEGWVAAKITKAADYLSSVKHYMEYEMISSSEPAEEVQPEVETETPQDYKETLQNKLSDQLKKKTEAVLEDFVGKPITEEEFEKLAEKQDACYHKVKARYKVWPSAYASGALVQCRKKGAKNWGNSKKK